MATFPRTRNSRSVSPPKRKPRLDAGGQLPFRSANPEPLQEMGEMSPTEASKPLSPVAERLAGYVSPLRARTMKEYDQQICDLKKENFHLKLRMYFLEEKMDKKFEGDVLDLHKLNLQLQVDAEALRKELEQKHDLLEEALGTLEKLENNHRQEIHTLKTKTNNEKAIYEKKIHSLQKQLSANSAKFGLEEIDSDISRRSSVSDPSTNSDFIPNWSKIECDRKSLNEIQELKKSLNIQSQELQTTKLQLEEQKKRQVSLENELHSRNVIIQNFSETLQQKEKDMQQLKQALEMKSGAIDMINSAVHTAVYKATMAARKGDKIGITVAREELKTVLRKILLQCNEDYEGIDVQDKHDICEKFQYLQEELMAKDEIIKSQQSELEKTKEKLNHLQTTFQSVQLELSQQIKQHTEKDSLINRLQASLKDAERRIENLLREQNEIITISKKSLQTLQSNIKDKDSIINDLQKNIKKAIEQKDHEIDKLQMNLIEKDQDLSSAKRSIDALNADVSTNKKECEGVKKDLDEYKCKLVKLTNETKKVTENLDMATKELNELRENKEDETSKLTQALQEMKKKLHFKDCDINQLQKTVKYKDEEINRIDDDYNRLQSKVEKLEIFLMQKEEEVFTSFQIIDEMRRIIQGSIDKDKGHGLTDSKRIQDFSQSTILKELRSKLGNLLNQNYTNISKEYSKQLEITIAAFLQHVYNAPCKISQPHDKMEGMQCLLNTFQQTAVDLQNCKEKKYENQNDSSVEDNGLNQLSDKNHENQIENSHKQYDTCFENKQNITKYEIIATTPIVSTAAECKEDKQIEALASEYQINIVPTSTYYNNLENIDFPVARVLQHSYSDIALKTTDTPTRQRSVESLPAEIEMHYEGWSPDFLPPPILPQSPFVSTTMIAEKSCKNRQLNNLWSQSLSHFGHSNDIEELKEEICVLVLKLRQLWEQKNDSVGKASNKQYTMHAKELDVLQQQLQESEQLTCKLQQHMAEMAIFLKQLLEIEPNASIGKKSDERKENLPENIQTIQQSSETYYNNNIDKETLQNSNNEKKRAYENTQILSEERYFDTDPCDTKTDIIKQHPFNHIYPDEIDPPEYVNSVESSNRKWWSASPLYIPHSEWINSEVTKIQDSDTWNGTDQVVVLEASDSDDILLLLNDRGLPKDVFLCNNQQSWNNQSCWQNNSLPCPKKQEPIKETACEKLDSVFQQWGNNIVDKSMDSRNLAQTLQHWSSDSDIWSEPDREVSMQRIGVDLTTIQSFSGEPVGPVLETVSCHKTHLQQALNRIGTSDESPIPTNRTSPSSSSRSHQTKWKQKLEFYLHKLEGLISTLSLELQHHHNLSGEVVAQLTILPTSEKDVMNSGLSSIIQDYSQTMTLLEERISELVSDNKQLQDIMQRKLSGKLYGRKRTSTSDSSRKNTSRKPKNNAQLTVPIKQSSCKLSPEKDMERIDIEEKSEIKKLETRLEMKTKECERLMRANEILEAKCSYSCPLGRHDGLDDSLSNIEWNKEEVRSLKHEIDKQEQREKQIEQLVLQMKEELETKDRMWQDVQNKLIEYRDVNEQLELMCKDKDCQLESAYENISKLQAEIYIKDQETTKLKLLVDELNHDIEQCRKRSVGLEEQSSDRQQELEKTKERMKDTEMKCAKLQESLQESNECKTKLMHKNLSLEDKLLATQQKLEYHKAEREKQSKENETKAKREKDAIQNELTSLEVEIRGLKSQLDYVSTIQLEQRIQSRKNSVESKSERDENGKMSLDNCKDNEYQLSSNQDENALLMDLVTEMRQLRTELNNSVNIRKQLHQQMKNSRKKESQNQMNKLQDVTCNQNSTLSDLSLDESSTCTLTNNRTDSPSSASVESSDSFNFMTPSKLRIRNKTLNAERKNKVKTQCDHHLDFSFMPEIFFNHPDESKQSSNTSGKHSMSSTESENNFDKLNVSELTGNDYLQVCSGKQISSKRKSLKLELPTDEQSRQLLSQGCKTKSGGEVTPQSSGSDQKSTQWSQCSSIDSPVSRVQFSSPDLGIESDPNRESYFPFVQTKEPEEWESTFPSRMSVTSAHSAPITVALDYTAKQGSTACDTDVKTTEKSNKAIIAQNDYSLHAIGRLEDYELLKKVIEEAILSLKEIMNRIKLCSNKKVEHSALREIDSSCHDVRIWLLKGWHLIGSFQTTAYVQEMQIRNTTLLKENQWLQEEILNTRDELSDANKQLRDITDKLQIAKGEKQLMENTITWHLTKTCKKLQEARSNLIRKDLLKMRQH